MDLDFYVRVRTCKKRATGKQPLGPENENAIATMYCCKFHVTTIL